jgi:2-polyprenyl-3-methyl-5-hydroxy-6-metoxy-1,4-benzoquinol methylase
MLSPDDIRTAYRFSLGREPDAGELEQHARDTPDLAALGEILRSSEEFDRARVPRLPAFLDCAGPMRLEVEVDRRLLEQMFARVEQTWQALGQTEPYWSVRSCADFRLANYARNAAAYHASGRKDLDRLTAWLRRNEIDGFGPGHTACEYGCGTGRVTGWLASRFSRVIACDISRTHLQLARNHLQEERISNVSLRHIDSLDALGAVEPVDLVLSFLVLQHNPPPLIAFILERMLAWLKPRGIAFFQLPTYTPGYEFAAESYVSRPPTGEIELHVPRFCCARTEREAGSSGRFRPEPEARGGIFILA